MRENAETFSDTNGLDLTDEEEERNSSDTNSQADESDKWFDIPTDIPDFRFDGISKWL